MKILTRSPTTLPTALILLTLGFGIWSSVSSAATTDPMLLSPLDVLLIKEDLRSQLAKYEMLTDGDGTGHALGRSWSDTLFVPQAVFEAYGPDGRLDVRWVGQEAIYQKSHEHSVDASAPVVHRHYLVSTIFDEVSQASARTRSTALIISAAKGQGEKEPTSRMVMLLTYHITWVKTSDGWRILRDVLRRDS